MSHEHALLFRGRVDMASRCERTIYLLPSFQTDSLSNLASERALSVSGMCDSKLYVNLPKH